MADNPHVNKVDLADGSTLIDLTGDTATAGDVVRGETFHLASGAQATGTMDVAGAITDAQVDSVLADSAPTGTDSLRLSQLTRFWNGLKTKFAALVHYHTALGDSSVDVLSVDVTKKSVAMFGNSAAGISSLSHGMLANAPGNYSHAEGGAVIAGGKCSHAEGYGTTAYSDYQHASGKHNISDRNNTYVEIVGNGTSEADGTNVTRSNARTLDWDGNAWHAGEVTATESVTENGVTTTVSHNLTEKLDEEDYLGGLTWNTLNAKFTWDDLAGNSSASQDTHTENYNLLKPGRLSTTAVNGNMDIIDSALDSIADSTHALAASDITSGQLAIANGGTGAFSALAARANLGCSRAYFGTCSTTAGTAAKVVTCDDFQMDTGALICVRFTNTNTASDATMNVNNRGARFIQAKGAYDAANVTWMAGETVPFVYDGTYFRMVGSVGVNALREYVSQISGTFVKSVSNTLYGYSLKRQCDVVQLVIRFASLSVASDLVIGTVSENCRPTGSRFIYGNASGETFMLTVNTNGEVKVISYERSFSANYPVISGMYML